MLMEKGDFIIREKSLRDLFCVLCAEDVPMEKKVQQLRKYEDWLFRRNIGQIREAKLALLRELLWLMYGDRLKLLEAAMRDRESPAGEEASGSPAVLVKAAHFALGGITEEEVSDIMEMMWLMKADGVGARELPFL